MGRSKTRLRLTAASLGLTEGIVLIVNGLLVPSPATAPASSGIS